MQYLAHWLVAGSLLMGVVGAVVTGEWLILLFVPPVAIPYVLFDRAFRRQESPDERLAAELPGETRRRLQREA